MVVVVVAVVLFLRVGQHGMQTRFRRFSGDRVAEGRVSTLCRIEDHMPFTAELLSEPEA